MKTARGTEKPFPDANGRREVVTYQGSPDLCAIICTTHTANVPGTLVVLPK